VSDCRTKPGVTKAALSFAWFGEAKPLQNQVSLSAKPEGAELVLSSAEQALWFCLGAAELSSAELPILLEL